MEEHVSGPGLPELYQGLNILIVGAIIYFGAWKSIKSSLQARREGIAGRLNSAGERLKQLTADTQRVRAEMKDLESSRKRLLMESQANAQKTATALIENAKQTADKMLKDAKLAAEHEVTLAFNRLKEEFVQEAIRLAQAQAASEQSKDMHNKFVAEFSQGSLKNGH